MSSLDKLSDDPLLNVQELSEYLGYAEGTIRNKVSRDEIPYKKVGKFTRFRKSEIDAWIEAQSGNGEAG